LTRPLDKHLDSDELNRLVSLRETSVSGSEQLSELALREVQRHVESCQDCSRKLQRHQFVHSEILRMRVPNPTPPTPECVGDAEWLEVAAGYLPETKTRELMKHAAQCGHCGPLLKNAAEALVDEATPSEEALLASLQSARPEWRKNMAVTLRDSARDPHPNSSWWRAVFTWPAPAYAFAGIIAVAVVAWIGVRALHPPSVDQLLAQAYNEHRTLEVRIPGAKYSPMQAQRGAEQSDFDKPQSLLKAEDLIGDNLRKNPNDPEWLQARARADLLDGNYDSAIKSLERAREAQPDSASILTDLGSAYSVRSQSAGRPIDDGRAVELLTQALAKSPENPIALFNRALAFERLFLYTDAVGDWEHYLRVDPRGEWADEARRRLEAVKQKIEERKESLSEPLLTPQNMAKISGGDQHMEGKVDGRVEDYLLVAIADWAPQAFPERSEKPSADARSALSILAAIARERHEDLWLTDFLHEPTTEPFSRAVKNLSDSVHASEKGDYLAERDLAHKAAGLFRLARNTAGELRANAEEVYSDHLLWEGHRCLALLSSITDPIHRHSYTWLEAQMSLEQSNCANAVADLGEYREAIDKGLSLAERYKYPALRLRALGFEILSHASVGECGKAFQVADRGLRLFWAGHADLMKGYNLYFNLESAAEELRLPSLQVALLHEATGLIDAHPNPLIRAMAHTWYGKAAYLANLPQVASTQFAQATDLLKLSPQTVATQKDEMDAEIYLANAEIRQGDVEQAAKRLNTIKPILEKGPSFDPLIGFYSAQADIALVRANSPDTEASLRSAIYIAESALNSYRSEGERRQWAEQTRNAYSDAVEWKLRQGDGTSALELWEWYRGADLRSSDAIPSAQATPPDPSDAPPLPTPNAVVDRLPLLRQQTIVAFAAFDDGVAVWAYDDRGIYWHWIQESLPHLQQLASRFQRLCADPKSDIQTLKLSARSLYDLLVAPVDAHLVGSRTIVFEPDDALAAIPWEALVDSRSHYLAERGPIVVGPSLYRMMHLRRTTQINPNTKALIVSVSAPEGGLTPLPDAEYEAESVGAAFRAASRLRGKDATLAAIRREIRDADVFHFAGHAVASPERSGLILAELDPKSNRSRLIDASSFGSIETSSLQLAVLSACSSGEEMDFDTGTEPLAVSLLHLGVPHVVASRWSVDSRATAELMKSFYSNLLATGDIADAMFAARIAIALHPNWAHPYYWAAFELRGN
jgi:CHAT domain-containing protein/tetratricopeptide (TPR) repeat protein